MPSDPRYPSLKTRHPHHVQRTRPHQMRKWHCKNPGPLVNAHVRMLERKFLSPLGATSTSNSFAGGDVEVKRMLFRIATLL